MTRLMRFTGWGLRGHLDRLRHGKGLFDESELEDGWLEEHPARVELTDLAETESAVMRAEHDGAASAVLHRHLPLSLKVAGDRFIWPWLASFPFRRYTRSRWEREGRLSRDRVGIELRENALARMWWGAEHTRVNNIAEVLTAVGEPPSSDPYHLTELAIRQYSLQFVLASRDLYQSRVATVAFILATRQANATGDQMDEWIKNYNLVLSTLVPEAYEPMAAAHPYHVDADGCARLVRILHEIRSEPTTSDVGGEEEAAIPEPVEVVAPKESAAPAPPPTRRGVFRRLLDLLGPAAED